MEKIITGFPNYKITKDGRIFSNFKFKTNIPCNTWREVKQIYDKSCGYMLVTLCDGNGLRKNKRVHRLLSEAFLSNPNQLPQINHIDGNKLNNDLNNLEWCTSKQNAQHAVSMGLCDKRRESQEKAVDQYSMSSGEILNSYRSLHEAGRLTGVAWQNIHKVCKGIRKSAGGYYWRYN